MDTLKNILNISGAFLDYDGVSSDGIWNVKPVESILMMILLVNSFHSVLKRFHFSRFTSEVLAGIVLGPTVMEHYFGNAPSILFPVVVPDHVFARLSKLGYIMFSFLAAVRMDLSLIKKMGKSAFLLGFVVFVVPIMITSKIEFSYSEGADPLHEGTKLLKSSSATTYLSLITNSNFVMVTALLIQLKITHTQVGNLALASSLLSDLGKSSMYAYQDVITSGSVGTGFQFIGSSLAFIVFIVVVLREMVLIFIRRTPEGEPVKGMYTTITLATVFFLSSISHNAGLGYLFGPFIFGLVVPAESPLAEVLVANLNTLVSGFLLPLMTAFCSSKFNLWLFIREFDLCLNFKISLIGFICKMAVAFQTFLMCLMPLRHTVALTIILHAKGVSDVAQFLSFGDFKNINDGASGIFLVFLLQAFQPLLVKKIYNPADMYVGYDEKSIMLASDNAELQMLACAHRQEDAVATMKLLEYSNPTKQSPLSIYGLCLEELFGRARPPLRINHQLGQTMRSSEESRSQRIIDIFKYFKSQHKKLVKVNVFTAISHQERMHKEICWLAFDKACSLIILPFHFKNSSRNLNINVLETAPCSVGILIDRSCRTHGSTSIFVTTKMYSVAMLFFGGKDDREALAYALRMAGSPRVNLTVKRFITNIAPRDQSLHVWEDLVNTSIIKNARHKMSGSMNFNYTEETVRDGADTLSTIKSMVGDYDLIIVGRRHETEPRTLLGLSERIALPELGHIGDLLASDKISNPIQVLIVQAQIMDASHSSTLNS